MSIEKIIELKCYPLDQLDGVAGAILVNDCRHQLEQTGCCLLPDFMLPAYLDMALWDGLSLYENAHPVNHAFAYDDVDDESMSIPLDTLPADHPRHHKSLTKIRFVARDLLDKNNPLLALHRWSGMTEFIGKVMQHQIYPLACPLSSCIITIAEEGELQDWHFDSCEFIVTIMLEKPHSGGSFEYVRNLRTADGADDFDGISRILKGDRDPVTRPDIEPGTLTLFKGQFNLHRAAPVDPGSRRVMAVLSYEREPNKTGTSDYLKLFYGRSLSDQNDKQTATV